MPRGQISVTVRHEQGRDETGRFLGAVETGAHATVMELANRGASAARAAAPKRTGVLAASIRILRAAGLSATFGTDVRYAGFQDEGTGPKGAPGQFLTNREDFWAIGPVRGNPPTHFMRAGEAVIRSSWRGVLRSNMP